VTTIAIAARRFLDQQDTVSSTIHELFAGHLRSIVGGLTIEEMIHNRVRPVPGADRGDGGTTGV
jgi:uncharacterized membrane protein YqiK